MNTRRPGSVTCNGCGYRQRLERPIEQPETRHLICHNCEGVLAIEITPADVWDFTPVPLWVLRLLLLPPDHPTPTRINTRPHP